MRDTNDIVLSDSPSTSEINQRTDNTTIFYSIEGLYTDELKKKVRNKYSILLSPPVLHIENDMGEVVNIQLTRELTEGLITKLSNVRSAYYGEKKKADWIGVLKRLPDDIKANSVVYVFLGLLLGLLIKYYFL